MSKFNGYHDEVDELLDSGEISAKEAYRQHKEIEEEENEYYG